jgi:glycosyltransferase involved in cell wall biosynthesis
MRPVFYVTNAPAPYKTGMLDALAALIPELKVFYLIPSEFMRSWRDPLAEAKHLHEMLKSVRINLRKMETAQYLSFDILARIIAERPRAVIFGPYSQIVFMAAMLLCRALRIPFIIWYESHDLSSVSPGPIRSLGRRVKRFFLGGAARVVTPGAMAKASAINLGVAEEAILIAPHAVDVAFFSASPSPEQATAARAHIAGYDRALLYVGQYIERKNINALIQAFSDLQPQMPGVCLVLAGGKLAPDQTLPPHVFSAGYLQAEELRALYHACDGAILPSRTEVWGLVVNEALAAGKPVLVSRTCGAAEQIDPGRNGLLFDANDPATMKAAILDWNAAAMKGQWRTEAIVARQNTFEAMARTFLAAVDATSSNSLAAKPN